MYRHDARASSSFVVSLGILIPVPHSAGAANALRLELQHSQTWLLASLSSEPRNERLHMHASAPSPSPSIEEPLHSANPRLDASQMRRLLPPRPILYMRAAPTTPRGARHAPPLPGLSQLAPLYFQHRCTEAPLYFRTPTVEAYHDFVCCRVYPGRNPTGRPGGLERIALPSLWYATRHVGSAPSGQERAT